MSTTLPMKWAGSRPTLVMAMLPLAIALNLVGGYMVNTLKLPLFADSFGTVLMGVLFGPIVGAATGVMSNLVGGLIVNPVMPWFILTAAFIGYYSGTAAKRGWLAKVWTAVVAGFVLGIITALISAPVAAWVFGGVTGSGAYSLIVAWGRSTGETLMRSTLLAGFASDPVDKAVTVLLVSLAVRSLPVRLRDRFPGLPRVVR